MEDETTRHALVELLEDVGCEVFAYAGRGMRGNTCLALSGKLGDMMAELVGACLNTDMPDDAREDVERAVRGMRTDALGMDQVIYFPDVAYERSRSEERS